MGATVMAKRRKQEQPTEQPTKTRLVPLSNAGECTACQAHRKKLAELGRLPSGNLTEIYSVHGRTRYCRCRICGRTWKTIV